MEISKSLIENAAWAADLDEDRIYHNYSGRAMYGKKCFGVVGSIWDFAKFMVQLTQANLDVAWELADAVASDSMGLDSIWYFPGFQLTADENE